MSVEYSLAGRFALDLDSAAEYECRMRRLRAEQEDREMRAIIARADKRAAEAREV